MVRAHMLRGTPAGDLGWPLRRAVQRFGDAPAVIDGQRSITYAQLAQRIGALSRSLDDLGVAPGARVGFLGANSLAHLECVIGVPSAGRVLVDLNFRLTPAELAFMASDCELEMLVAAPDQLEVARALRDGCPSLRTLVVDGRADCLAYEDLVATEPAPPRSIDEHTLASISYTGGTTGRPKGVMLSHANLLSNARHNLLATGHAADHTWLHVCPMFHVAGTANIFACTWVGARQVVLPRFDARTVIAAIREQAITHMVLVPTMLGMLLDELQDDPDPPLSTLRHIQYAASPISSELQRRVLDRFPHTDIAQFYGMTEAAPTVTHLTPEDHRRGISGEEPHTSRLRSIGAPVIGVEAEVHGPDGARLGPGEIGEVWVRGPNVMLGYWNRPQATEAALAEGWYRSGDAARTDADGYFYLVDRLKDMIITGGENVYSIEVEAALLAHPAVNEAAVFGIPDARWGEAVHAVVSLAPGAAVTAEALIAHCRDHIAGYKIPRTIECWTDPLPKSGAGKLLKHTLREPHWIGHDRRVS